MFQAELPGDPLLPGLAAERLAPCDAAADRLHFRLGLWTVHVLHPTPPQRNGRVRQQRLLFFVAANPPIKAAPPPAFRLSHQARPQRVPLDVPQHGRQVVVAGDRERLEAALINVAHAGGAVMGVEPLRMRDRQPAKELRNLLVPTAAGPDDEMPVVAHQHVGQNPQGDPLVGFEQNLLEGGEIGVLLEQPQPPVRSIEHVVSITADNGPSAPGHAHNVTNPAPPVKQGLNK